MATIDRDILTIVEPTIQVDKVFQEAEQGEEAENAKVPENQNRDTIKQDQAVGGVYPLIQISSLRFGMEDVEDMELDMTGFVPEITVTIADSNDKLVDVEYPLDGDVISLYLKPRPENVYRPIRIDFDILSVKNDPRDASDPEAPIPPLFYLEGRMKVPLLTADVLQGFAAGNSFDHLLECAEGLGLGFASNEEGTDDSQIRICAQQTREEFIQQTAVTAYKDDESFFKAYIDPHYYLSFVNVNKQFSLIDEMEEIDAVTMKQTDLDPGSNAEDTGTAKTSLLLTNFQDYSGTQNYMTRFSLINQSGEIWNENGYSRDIRYLNLNENLNGGENGGLENFLITPLNTPGAEENLIPMRGRPDEETYSEQNTIKYIGKQPSEDFENMHSNYMYALAQNFGNMQEIQKMQMKIELEVVNWSLYRYQRVPVAIYTDGMRGKGAQETRDTALGEDEQPNTPEAEAAGPTDYRTPGNQIKNEFLTGYYVIQDMKYKYDKETTKITQELTLLRREWPIPAKANDN